MSDSLRIVVSGLIAQYPLGGVTWDYLQYVVGLARLGHDVYYLEDTGQWPYNPVEGGVTENCDFNVNYLANVLSRYGLGDKWMYRFPRRRSQWSGLHDEQRESVLHSADLLINVSGTIQRPEEYRYVPRMAYIDSDPVFTQVKLARRQHHLRKVIDTHDVQFSFGECHSAAVPVTGHNWLPTRQPIVLSEWRTERPYREVFTTVMNWTSYKDLEYEGITYAQKDVEFEKFLDLPSLVAPVSLEVAANVGKTRQTPRERLAQANWRIVDPAKVCPDLDSYREYVQSSKAEWSVAKNGYVVGQSGWFSCRSACYLAAGRPTVVQDTGFAQVIPVGEGILTFRSLAEAVEAIWEVERNYDRHAQAARAIAEQYFDSSKVLSRLIEDATSNHTTTRNAI